MKIQVVFLSLYCLACNPVSSSENTSEPPTEIVADLKPQNACETFTKDFLAQTLGWSAENIIVQNMGYSEGKRSLCRFDDQEETLWVRFGWKSEKAIENKVLETQFQGYLTNGENGITYEALNGNKTLFGYKEADATNPPFYIFRTRFDNKAEVTFEFYSSKRSKPDVQKLFNTLLNKI